jgi:hypothetical protein
MASMIAKVVVALMALSLVGSVEASAVTTPMPSITISPGIALTSNQSVTITGSGFLPNEASLVALECVATAKTTAGCNVSPVNSLVVNATGDFTSTLSVTTGTIGNGSCGTTESNSTCLIAIESQTTSTFIAHAAISFASGPGVAVTPSTNLTNDKTILITGAGFSPSEPVYALECLESATNEAGCDTGTATPIAVTSTGTLPSTSFQVVTGTIGNGTCGTSASNYDSCIIEVATITGTDVGVATIDFATPIITPAPKALSVNGAAIPGRTVNIAILGRNFTAGPEVMGPAGTVVTILSNTSSRIVIRVHERARARAGTYNLTIHFASGKRTSIAYRVT